MAKKISSLVDKLCDGFLEFRRVRLNAENFEAEYDALCCAPNALLQKNMMFLALNSRMRCDGCKQLCTASNCGYSSELLVTAAEIINRWRRPKFVTLKEIVHNGTVYIHTTLLEALAEKADDAVRGKADEKTAHDIRARIYTWGQQRRQQLYDLLDEHCKRQPVYLSLMK